MKVLQLIYCKSLEIYQEDVYDGIYFSKITNRYI